LKEIDCKCPSLDKFISIIQNTKLDLVKEKKANFNLKRHENMKNETQARNMCLKEELNRMAQKAECAH